MWGAWPPNAFLCNSEPTVCESVKSFTHVLATRGPCTRRPLGLYPPSPPIAAPLLTAGPRSTQPACRAAACSSYRSTAAARAQPQQQTRRSSRRRCCRPTGKTDGRTDRRTDTRSFYDVDVDVEDVLAQAMCLYAAYHIPRGPHNKLVANNLTSASACVSSCGCFSMFRTQTDIFTSEVTTWMTPITHSSVLLIA